MLRGEFDPAGQRFTRTDRIAASSVAIGAALLPFGFIAARAAALGANLIVVGLLVLTRHFPGDA